MSDAPVLSSGSERPHLRARVRAALEHRESRHAIKYGIVGVANVAIDFLLYALLVHLGVWYVAAKTLSLVAATINGYTFNRRWTFRAGRHATTKLVRYLTVQGTGLLLALAILTTLVELAGVAPLPAGAMAVPVVASYCFLANRLWTFGPHVPPAVAPYARG